MQKIPKRIANIIMNSLKGGVVPKNGVRHITVGRKDEIDALLKDAEIIEDAGSTFRFIVGKFGTGKSFLIQAFKTYILEKGFICMETDLSPERRLVGNKSCTYRYNCFIRFKIIFKQGFSCFHNIHNNIRKP